METVSFKGAPDFEAMDGTCIFDDFKQAIDFLTFNSDEVPLCLRTSNLVGRHYTLYAMEILTYGQIDQSPFVHEGAIDTRRSYSKLNK